MKIGITGSGFVGSTAGYALVLKGIGTKIVLVDKDKKKAAAEAEDISHAIPFSHSTRIIAGDYSDLKDSSVVIVAAGVNQNPGESRLQLLERNAEVFRQVIPNIVRYAPDAIFLIAVNPVDVMTHLAARCAAEFDIPSSRVIGSGTILDTARFRAILGRFLGVDVKNVHGYVIGEHGDSEVLTWSTVRIGGLLLEDFCALRGIQIGEPERKYIDKQVRNAAYRIIEGKGATYYGIGGALAHIVDIVIHNHQTVTTVCTPINKIAEIENVTVSLPHIIGNNGITATLPLALNEEEEELFYKSAYTIKELIYRIEKKERVCTE